MLKTSIRAAMDGEAERGIHPLKWAFERGSRVSFAGLEFCLEAVYRSAKTGQAVKLPL